MSKFAINMNDGTLAFRSKEIDAQVNMKPVPDAVVEMILRKEVTEQDVISAISAKIKESGDFDLKQYIEDLKKLNVRQSNPQLKPEVEPLKDRSDEEVSPDEIFDNKKRNETAKEEKKARAKKVNAVLDKADNMPDMFK